MSYLLALCLAIVALITFGLIEGAEVMRRRPSRRLLGAWWCC